MLNGAFKQRQQGKTGVTRNRQIFSCKRCYTAKRKCDKTHPTCLRCQKTKHACEYFLKPHKKSKESNTLETAECPNDVAVETKGHLTIKKSPIARVNIKPSLTNILNTEINPQVSKEENDNFTLVISSTGEYSKFFPTSIFPFHDHQANLSMVLNFNDTETKTSLFDFSTLVEPINELDGIKIKIPNRQVMDFLTDHFIEYILPFVPIIDAQEFLYEYNRLWDNFDDFDNNNFLVIFFAVIFASCTNIMLLKDLQQLNLFDKYHGHFIMNEDCEKLREDSFRCIQNLKRMLNSDATPSMSIIVGLTIVYYLGSVNGANASVQIASLVKLSQVFGLHRTLISSCTALPMRDVIYSFVWYLDGLSAYYSGFPPNMYLEFYQCNHDSLANSNDINIIFLRGRLHNTRVWNRILFEFNKINKTDSAAFDEVENLYNESLNQVNAVNELIKHNNQATDVYKAFLMTETRMGLRKSALMINALKNAVKNTKMGDYKKRITPELALQAILLVSESIYKARLGADAIKESIWFYRFAMPFQAMYIILSHLKMYPDQALNFSMLDTKYDYTLISEYAPFSYLLGDIRLKFVDYAIRTLSFLINFWPAAQIDRFETIVKYRNFVYDHLNMSKKNTPVNIHLEVQSDLSSATSGYKDELKVSDSQHAIHNITDSDLFDKMIFDPTTWDDYSNFWVNQLN